MSKELTKEELEIAQWNAVHSNLRALQYPDNRLERFVSNRYYNVLDRKDIRFFDVGCGRGASTWYLSREGFSVAAIDLSPIAVEWVKARLERENLEALMMCGDITELELKEDFFDCVVDISSLCYVSSDKIEKVMKELHKVLKPGGCFFSITPTQSCAKVAFTNVIPEVDFSTRFQTFEELKDTFKSFSSLTTRSYSYGLASVTIELWEVVAVK